MTDAMSLVKTEKIVPVGSFTMTGTFKAKSINLDPVEWVNIPQGDWSAIGLSGVVNSDMSIDFTILSNLGEKIETCTSLKAIFDVSSNQAWAPGKPVFMKGVWKGEYACGDQNTIMHLTLDTVGTTKTGAHSIVGTFEFSKRVTPELKVDNVNAIHVDISPDIDLNDLGALLGEIIKSFDGEELEALVTETIEELQESKDDE